VIVTDDDTDNNDHEFPSHHFEPKVIYMCGEMSYQMWNRLDFFVVYLEHALYKYILRIYECNENQQCVTDTSSIIYTVYVH
jgi:hypothetical protein